MFDRDYLNRLQKIYSKPSNDLCLLYGSRGADLIALIKSFCNDKKWFYYNVPDVFTPLQEQLFIRELNNHSRFLGLNKNDYENILLTYLEDSPGDKKVIVFDGFTNLYHNDPTYINLIINLISEKCAKGSVLFILMTDNVKWVNHDFNALLGRAAVEFTDIIYLKESSFDDIVNSVDFLPDNELFSLYCTIGGWPLLWKNISKGYSGYRDFLINSLLDVNSSVFNYGLNILPADFRQQTIYQTILYYIAAGNSRLNELYDKTGLSRAKLSVYIGNLLEHDILYKAKSCDVGETANIAKGVYHIKSPFVHFWYYFIFPNMSMLLTEGSDKFFKRIIVPTLCNYIDFYYPDYCIKKLYELGENGKLDFEIYSASKYLDKQRVIDYILESSIGRIILKCDIRSPHLSYRDYELVEKVANEAGIKYDKIALYSAGGFDQKLNMTSKVSDKLLLFDGKDRFASKYI